MTLDQLENLCDDLLVSDSDTSEILAALSDEELRTAYSDVLRQWSLELAVGAYENSSWLGDILVIGCNQGPIHASETAFYAILVELGRRGVDRPVEVAALRKTEAQLEREQ
jgi:hypothetical protein